VRRPDLELIDDENPEWTAEIFAQAIPHRSKDPLIELPYDSGLPVQVDLMAGVLG
jgi:hypothetical protein